MVECGFLTCVWLASPPFCSATARAQLRSRRLPTQNEWRIFLKMKGLASCPPTATQHNSSAAPRRALSLSHYLKCGSGWIPNGVWTSVSGLRHSPEPERSIKIWPRVGTNPTLHPPGVHGSTASCCAFSRLLQHPCGQDFLYPLGFHGGHPASRRSLVRQPVYLRPC